MQGSPFYKDSGRMQGGQYNRQATHRFARYHAAFKNRTVAGSSGAT